MRKLVAIVTSYNREDFISRCVESLLESANGGLDVRVIVMDNGSVDGTSAAASAFGERVRVLRTEDNRPIAEVVNRGFAAAAEEPDSDFYMVMNDDTQFAPDGVAKLIEACDERPNALFTPLQMNYRQPDHVDPSAFDQVQEIRELMEDALLKRPLKCAYPIRTIIGAAIFGRREVWEDVGFYDELFWFYGVDDDVCERARYMGYEILIAPASVLFHAHGKLNVPPTSVSPSAQVWKWRNETQARYLFLLKSPKYGFARNVLRCFRHALATTLICVIIPWPRGVWMAMSIFGWCAARLPHIAAVRRRHFDPAQRGKITARQG